jgi:hypothetical protein
MDRQKSPGAPSWIENTFTRTPSHKTNFHSLWWKLENEFFLKDFKI